MLFLSSLRKCAIDAILLFSVFTTEVLIFCYFAISVFPTISGAILLLMLLCYFRLYHGCGAILLLMLFCYYCLLYGSGAILLFMLFCYYCLLYGSGAILLFMLFCYFCLPYGSGAILLQCTRNPYKEQRLTGGQVFRHCARNPH